MYIVGNSLLASTLDVPLQAANTENEILHTQILLI